MRRRGGTPSVTLPPPCELNCRRRAEENVVASVNPGPGKPDSNESRARRTRRRSAMYAHLRTPACGDAVGPALPPAGLRATDLTPKQVVFPPRLPAAPFRLGHHRLRRALTRRQVSFGPPFMVLARRPPCKREGPQAGSAASPPAGYRCLGVRGFQISPLLRALLVLVRSLGEAVDHLCLSDDGKAPPRRPSRVPACLLPRVRECRYAGLPAGGRRPRRAKVTLRP
jgi:hypothetical protein